MLPNKILQNIQQNFPELLSAKLLLAVSGGVDSMVMLDVLKKLNLNIFVAHCNFKLRGEESDAETQFLKAYLEQQNIPHQIIYFDTEAYAQNQKLSIQLAARELRYNWFYDLLKNQDLDYIITAHHLDDQVETFLINFTRGTGIEGLTGMPAKNDKIRRPFLTASRQEILDYAKTYKVEWRDDSSNASTKYFRNKIRHKVVPVLKELNTDFLQTFQETLVHLKQYQDGFKDGFSFMVKEIVSETNGQIFIDIPKLESLSNPNAFLYAFLKDYNFTAWKDIYTLAQSSSGKIVNAPKHVLLKDRNQLILKEFLEEEVAQTYDIFSIQDFHKLPFKVKITENPKEFNPEKNRILIDKEKLKFPLQLRKWKEGDYFYPLGMDGKKKVSKYFKDQKLSLFQKQEAWLLVQEQTQVIWIVNYRADKRFNANKTINTLQIEILK